MAGGNDALTTPVEQADSKLRQRGGKDLDNREGRCRHITARKNSFWVLKYARKRELDTRL